CVRGHWSGRLDVW
nr:immunoglobulin heavy chain junction region [Macaca mulatta]